MNIISDKKSKPKPEPKEKTKAVRDYEAIKERAQLTYFDADKKEVKSLKEILAKTKEIQEVYIPILGCKLKIGHINMLEFSEIVTIDDKNKMAIEMLFRLLHSADPAVALEDIQQLPFQITTAIIEQVMGGGLGFPTDTT